MQGRDDIDLYGVKESEYRVYEESRENKRKGIKKSSYYHRFFEGYAEIYEDQPSGGRKLTRIYASPWKALRGTRREWILRKVIYGLLMAAAAIVFAVAGTRSARCNTVWSGGLTGGIETVLLLLSAVACVRYVRARRKMTIYEMKSSAGFFRRIMLAAGLGSLVMTGIALFFAEYGIALLYLLCAVLLLLASFLEYRAVYEDEENPVEVPAEATFIR